MSGPPLPSLDACGPDRPLVIAHRGAAALYPENTIEAYRAAHASGLRVLEQDVRVLADGALVVMHDATVDRTTHGTGPTMSFDRGTLRTLRIRTQSHHEPMFADIAPPLFDDVLAEFRDRAVFVPEAKAPGSGAAVVASLQAARIPTTQALVQAFALADLEAAVAAGYPAMFLSERAIEIDAVRAMGVTWAGLWHGAPDAVLRAWVDAGFKVVAYTVNARVECDRLLALGVSGVFSDNPLALIGDRTGWLR